MYLTPTEQDRLLIFAAAELARRNRARGLRLAAPEAVALVCDEMHLAARAGGGLDEVVAAGTAALSVHDVMEGVPDLVPEIRLEVLLEEGSRLVILKRPFGA